MKNNLQKILPILSIVFLVFCCFIFIFLYKEINFNKKAFEENETKWQQETERREGIKLLNSSISKIEKEKSLLESHFAQSSNIVPFLDTIEALGNKVGAKTEVMLVDVPVESKNLNINMKASGSFEEIYKFITLLENSPYELEFISIDVQKQGAIDTSTKNNKKTDWEADLKMKLLSFIQ
ncbi:MAG: hypothetical protein WCO07_02655 [bacterium]